MRGTVIHKIGVNKDKRGAQSFTKKYLLKPLSGGILGYIIFFTLLIISKYLGYMVGNRETFQIDLTDWMLSLLGFVFIFVIKLKESSNSKVSN